MAEPKIVIDTMMTKEDNKKFLYFSTFKKNTFTLPMMALVSLIVGIILSYSKASIDYSKLIKIFLGVFALNIVLSIIRIEMKNRKQVKADKSSTFDSFNTLSFYDNKFVVENKSINARGELAYDQFSEVLESKEYFILYLTSNQASLIRKKDINNVEEFRSFIIEKFGSRFKNI